MTAPDDLSATTAKPFSDAIAKIDDLLNQSSRAFLLGAGCSKCAGLPLTNELTALAIASDKLGDTSKAILAAVKDKFDGSSGSHIEDYLSEIVDMLAIAERRVARGATSTVSSLGGSDYSVAELRAAIEEIKLAISEVVGKQVEIETHQAFVSVVHRPLRDGTETGSSVVDYLVLNYDRLIEDALALERIPFSDGIDGGNTGWWNPSAFDRSGLKARVLKLHGSIDWCELDGDPLPRRVSAALGGRHSAARRILIWPASTKYREVQLDPFAQLSERARRAIRPASGSQRVLVVCGYAFGDTHVNIELDRALRQSAGDLTVIAFSSDAEPLGQLEAWRSDARVREQVLIFARRGFFHAGTTVPSGTDLPWWKFENVVRLLGGER